MPLNTFIHDIPREMYECLPIQDLQCVYLKVQLLTSYNQCIIKIIRTCHQIQLSNFTLPNNIHLWLVQRHSQNDEMFRS